jgi:ethanolamine utilization cobalamin adenosyltransferase
METKLSNGVISSISPKTAFKSAIGSQAASAYQTLVSMVADLTKLISDIRTSAKAKASHQN